jgi:DNA gyrase subunit B
MYIGNTDSSGLSHLLFGLISNSLAEAVAGHGRVVQVTLRTDGAAEVVDDGRIFPLSETTNGVPSVQRAFTTFSAGARGFSPYQMGWAGSDYGVVTALSERLDVTVRSPSSRYRQAFHRGVLHAAVESGGPPDDRGLTIVFRPDPLIFGDARFDADTIRDRLRDLAFLHSGVRITLVDEANGTRDEFEYPDGIRDYVRFCTQSRSPLHPEPIVIRGEEQHVRYEIGLQWCEDEDEIVRSFANHYYTPTGGTHYYGLRSGVATGLGDFVQGSAPHLGEVKGEDARTGLTAVVSVWLHEPVFMGSIRSTLGNPEVEGIVKAAVRNGVRSYLEANPSAADRIVRAVVMERDLRLAAKAIRDQKRNRAE